MRGGGGGRGGVEMGPVCVQACVCMCVLGGCPFDLFRAAEREWGHRGLCLNWQTHLAGNCLDQTDSQSWKCMDKQKFTAPIGKVNRSHIRLVHKQ